MDFGSESARIFDREQDCCTRPNDTQSVLCRVFHDRVVGNPGVPSVHSRDAAEHRLPHLDHCNAHSVFVSRAYFLGFTGLSPTHTSPH